MRAHRQWAACVVGAVGLAIVGAVWVPSVAGAARVGSWAVVDSDGGLVRGRNAVSAGEIGTGRYEVVFAASVANCAFEATAGDPARLALYDPVVVTVAKRTSNTKGVFVTTVNQSTLHDSTFNAQDLDSAGWSQNNDPNILDSTTRPHITVHASGNGPDNGRRSGIAPAWQNGRKHSDLRLVWAMQSRHGRL